MKKIDEPDPNQINPHLSVYKRITYCEEEGCKSGSEFEIKVRSVSDF